MDDGRKRLIIIAAAGCMLVGGIILWFLGQMKDGETGTVDLSPGSGDAWNIYYNLQDGDPDGGYGNGNLNGGNGDGGYGNGSLNGGNWNGGYGGNGGSGSGNGHVTDGNADGGYGNGSLNGGSGDGGYGNGSLYGGDGSGGYGNGSLNGGGGSGGYGNGSLYGGDADGGFGGRDGENGSGSAGTGDISSNYGSMQNGIFGDERWDIYVTGLFSRISPDYAVDTLDVLRDQGVTLFIRATELCGDKGTETYADLVDDVQRQRWNNISGDIHAARYLWQLDEIILWYTLQGANWKDTTEYNDFMAYLAKNITDNAKREEKLKEGSFYHIITDLQGKMAGKALGYTWDEAMARVLLTAGDPLAEVVVKQEDYIPQNSTSDTAGNSTGTGSTASDTTGNTAETSNAADMVNMIVIDGPVNDSSLIIVPSN